MTLDHLPPAYRRAFKNKPDMAEAWLRTRTVKALALAAKATPAPSRMLSESTRPASEPVLLDDAALGDWADGLATRIGLQSELVWMGLNDGYQDAGGKDVAIPYLALYWILGAVKTYHCVDCPAIAMGSPYDPPGKGPNVINQTPGDGQTSCGAGCHCWLEYGLPAVSTPQNYVWRNGVFPGPGRAMRVDGGPNRESPYGVDHGVGLDRQTNYTWGEAALLNPMSEYFTASQQQALDYFRAKWNAWEDVRGDLPGAPDMFSTIDGLQDLADLERMWNSMSAQQRNTLLGMQEAIGMWNDATSEANANLNDSSDGASEDGTGLAEIDDESVKLWSFGFGRGFSPESAGSTRGRGSLGGGMIRTKNGERPVKRGPGGRLAGSGPGGWAHKTSGGRARAFGGGSEGGRGGKSFERGPEAASRRTSDYFKGSHANTRTMVGKRSETESRIAQRSPNEGAQRRTSKQAAGKQAAERAYIRRATTIQAERAQKTQTLQTLEGPQQVKHGDWIVTGVEGERYSMTDRAFHARYSAGKKPGTYTRIRERVSARPAGEHEPDVVGNGGRVLHAGKGDMIVRQADGDFAVVKAGIFAKTYQRASKQQLTKEEHARINERLGLDGDYRAAGITRRDIANPQEYTSQKVLNADITHMPKGGDPHKYWADPVSPREAMALRPEGRFTSVEGVVRLDRQGRPQNPWGETGITGRGILGKWGANPAADPIVTRVHNGKLEVAMIERALGGGTALPGGMVDRGETPLIAARREFHEEAGVRLNFSKAQLVHQGYVTDRRNTDNAWMETHAFHLHLSPAVGAKATLVGGDDAASASWHVIDKSFLDNLYANHGNLVRAALKNWEATSGNRVGEDGSVTTKAQIARAARQAAAPKAKAAPKRAPRAKKYNPQEFEARVRQEGEQRAKEWQREAQQRAKERGETGAGSSRHGNPGIFGPALSEPASDDTIELGIFSAVGRAFGGGGRAGRVGGGMSGMHADGRMTKFGRGHRFNGSERGTRHNEPTGKRGGGAAEREAGKSVRAQRPMSNRESPNSGAVRRGMRPQHEHVSEQSRQRDENTFWANAHSVKQLARMLGPNAHSKLWEMAGGGEGTVGTLTYGSIGLGKMRVSFNAPTHHIAFVLRQTMHGLEVHSALVRVSEKTANGGQLLLHSFEAFRANGVARVISTAMRGQNFNGYETWAKLGATGKIPGHLITSKFREQFGGIKRVEQLMDAKGGAAWWREHGDSFKATMDLRPGGRTAKILDRLDARMARQAEAQPPFSQQEFRTALQSATRFGNANKNMTAIAEIRGQKYLVKSVSGQGRYTEEKQQINEVAAAEGLRALGMGHLAVSHAYTMRGEDGRLYSVQGMEAGSARKYGGIAEAAKSVPVKTLQQLVIGQYLLGLQDNHMGNLLIDHASGSVKKVDNGYAFKHDTKMERRDAARAIWQAKAGERMPEGKLTHFLQPKAGKTPLSFSHAIVRNALAHQEQLMSAMGRFHLGAKEMQAMSDRFDLLRQVSDAHPRMTLQELEHVTGLKTSPFATRGD